MVLRKIVASMMSCLGINSQAKEPASSVIHESSSTNCTDPLRVVSLRIRLGDGRYLAYKETGVPITNSIYRVIIVHGFGSSKDMNFMAPQEVLEELGIYILLFDRAGYGESDPNPKRSLKSEASDIEELANQLQLGAKFYVISVSVGAYATWSCLKRIPHRLAGVALVVPYINYKWPSLPDELTRDDYRKNLSRWTLWVTRYTPRLVHWWLTQKVLPSSSTVLDRNPRFFSRKDLEVLKNTPGYQLLSKNKLKERVVFESIRRDFIVAFGKWDFDPLELENPLLGRGGKSSVHIWQGFEDKVVPVELQRFVSKTLPWIHYHEVPDGGHLLVYDSAVCEAILRSLLLQDDPPLYRPKITA
ncbi:hypothetical protein AgCh_022206 [Apium graveolens]